MKIYSLVRTELHNQTELTHFATLEATQKQMLYECSKIVGEEIAKLNNDYVTEDGMWHITTSDYYATLSNGNKIEFEIFERVIEPRDFMLHTIADKVCEIYPDCKDYYNIIVDSLDYFSDDNLPRMTETEISHFIYNDFESALACRAADKMNEGYDDDEIHQVVFDYLEGNRGFSFMAEIINGEKECIEQLKKDIDNECSGMGYTLFRTKEDTITSVADRVVERYTNSKKYYDIIRDTIKNIDESMFGRCLPTNISQEEIDNYIDSYLFGYMVERAAEAVCEDTCVSTSMCMEYIENNCEFYMLAKLMKGDLLAIDEIQRGINKKEESNIFNYVWVAKSHTDEGEEFRRKEEIKVFNADSYDSALKYIQDKYHTAKDIFIDTAYMNEDIVTYDDGKLFQVHSADNYDCWEGTLTKVYVEK